MIDIESVGVHRPRYRIDASEFEAVWGDGPGANVSSVAVPGPDEDALTMGVEAAERALDASSADRSAIGAVAIGTTTPPLEENDPGAQLVEMLGLARSTETDAFAQSTRAGVRALRTVASGDVEPALVVATDRPRGEPDDAIGQRAGAGAVAMILSDDGDAALVEAGQYARSFPGTRYRERAAATTRSYGATSYERRSYVETVGAALDALTEPIEAVAPTAPNGTMPHRATNDVDNDPVIYHRADELGDLGAASPFFGLLAAWEDGQRNVTLVGYGGGAAADAVRVEGSTTPVGRTFDWSSLTYAEYLRFRGEITSGGDR
ncbi:MAG: hypothetical protein ABEJ77_01835 [Halanaeroarchaeum sp.]